MPMARRSMNVSLPPSSDPPGPGAPPSWSSGDDSESLDSLAASLASIFSRGFLLLMAVLSAEKRVNFAAMSSSSSPSSRFGPASGSRGDAPSAKDEEERGEYIHETDHLLVSSTLFSGVELGDVSGGALGTGLGSRAVNFVRPIELWAKNLCAREIDAFFLPPLGKARNEIKHASMKFAAALTTLLATSTASAFRVPAAPRGKPRVQTANSRLTDDACVGLCRPNPRERVEIALLTTSPSNSPSTSSSITLTFPYSVSRSLLQHFRCCLCFHPDFRGLGDPSDYVDHPHPHRVRRPESLRLARPFHS